MNTLIKQEAERRYPLSYKVNLAHIYDEDDVAEKEQDAFEAGASYAQPLPSMRWVKASELPLESDLPDFVVTLIDGRVFAYDTWHNIKGLREVVKHHPEMLCLCLNKPKSPTL
jgi:hypothetical protein